MAAPSQLVGQTLGHYRILEQIGAGGMGVVYRAHDERLDRDVAVKVLPPGTLSDGATRKRFRNEALALSRLNHPNIAMVFDFDTQDGMDFLVTEFIPGATLDATLGQGFLAEKQVINLGLQLAEGLAAAHAQGIIHRDLKPGNLRITPDRKLKILDFGIAKIMPTGEEATETLTRAQEVSGTLPYMAPEQLRGEQPDSRTDIYAAGAVLYEMATGRRPFEQKLSTALVNDIINKPPPPPRQVHTQLSIKVEDLVLKCLEKEPENRYQSAKELAVDLRRLAAPSSTLAVPRAGTRWKRLAVATGAATAFLLVVLVGFNVGGLRSRLVDHAASPRIKSLAVLPLENLSGDPQQQYFADGMTEALITELSKISALKVISRTSAMQYKGATKPTTQIARELGVDAIVEGAVLREGDQVRITVQLIHGQSDTHLWADKYQRAMRSLLALQSEVAQAIATEIKITITPQESARLVHAPAVNPEAHEAYLKGLYHLNSLSEESLRKAELYFKQAIEKDPKYSFAYAGLAQTYYGVSYLYLPPKEAMPKARAAAERALELDDTLAEAHNSLALVKTFYDWDWLSAEREYKRALEFNPGYANAHEWYGWYLALIGRPQESIAELKRAQELDPLSVPINWSVCVSYFFARQYDQAIAQCRYTLEMDPNFALAHFHLGAAYEQKTVYDQAIAEFQKARSVDSSPLWLAALGHAYAVSGRKREAQQILRELQKTARGHFSYEMAIVYAGLRQNSQTFEWLQKACDDRSELLTWLMVDPRLDDLRSEPRFNELLRRVGLPQ